MAQAVAALALGDSCQIAFDRFSADSDLLALPVVEGGWPVGLVSRHDFLMAMGRPYGRALYSARPIELLMDSRPLIVDSDVLIESVGTRIVQEKPAALLRGFIVTQGGTYLGIGTGLSVLSSTLHSLMHRTEALSHASQAAIAASEAKSAFLATMSHELRTPLNAIIGFAELIAEQRFGPSATERYRDYAGDILGAGRHLLDLINDVLDISKIEAGRMELDLGARDMGDELRSLLRTLATQAAADGLRLEVEAPDGALPVFADGRALRQTLLNLASNALKFSPRGGLVRIALRPHDETGHSVLEVEDFGTGIPAAHLAKIWQPFERLDNSYSAARGGTGLGLALVQQLTGIQHGRIVMESEEGLGTRVRVFLPSSFDVFNRGAPAASEALELHPSRLERVPAAAPRAVAAARGDMLREAMLAWTALHDATGALPARASLVGRLDQETLTWITIYRPAGAGDFQLVFEGEAVSALTGENWRMALASEIDHRHHGGLQHALREVIEQGRPGLRLAQPLFQIRAVLVDRLLMPVLGPDHESGWVISLLSPQQR